jgi:phosphoribosylglycinamide formyltransferase-1
MPYKIAVLISGRGSNLGALIAAREAGKLPVEIVLVASNKASAMGLRLARLSAIPTLIIDPNAFPDRVSFDAALLAEVAATQPQLIVLAGFLRVLDPVVVAPWVGRMINIHPSLLPKYPGLHTHGRALKAGDRAHGASVHFVTADLDSGPVIAQVEIDVGIPDTSESLAARLLPLEHRLLVATVGLFAASRVSMRDRSVVLDGQPLTAPLRLNDDGRLSTAMGSVHNG